MNGNFLKICDDFKPDFLLSNGCHLISNEILNITKICNWNIQEVFRHGIKVGQPFLANISPRARIYRYNCS